MSYEDGDPIPEDELITCRHCGEIFWVCDAREGYDGHYAFWLCQSCWNAYIEKEETGDDE